MLSKSVIRFLHELLHGISHTRVSRQSPFPLLTSFLLPAGQISEKRAADAVCDVPACSGAGGTFSSLLPCSSTCLLWPLLDTLVIFLFFFSAMHTFRINSIFHRLNNLCKVSPWFQGLKWNHPSKKNKQPTNQKKRSKEIFIARLWIRKSNHFCLFNFCCKL